VHLVALHARDVKTQGRTGGVEHRIVAGALGAEAEVVTDQDVPDAQRLHQDVLDECLRRQRGQASVEGQHHTLVDAAALELFQLVAQGGDAGRGEFGLAVLRSEKVARVRFEGHGAGGHSPVACLVLQQRQHGLVATVHAIEVADGERTALGRGQGAVPEAAEDFHEGLRRVREGVTKARYIDTAPRAPSCGRTSRR
jgi:hypothetical protein